MEAVNQNLDYADCLSLCWHGIAIHESIEFRCLPWHGMFRKALFGCFVGGSQFVSECKKPHEELHDKTRLFNAEIVQMRALCICAFVQGLFFKVLQKLQNILLTVLSKMLVFPPISHYSSFHILP